MQRLLLPAAVLLPLAILGMGAWVAWTSSWDEARAELAHTADAAAEHARSLFEQHRLRAHLVDQILAGQPDSDLRAQEATLHARLRQALALDQPEAEPPFTLWVFDNAGRIVVNTETAASPRGDFSDRAYFRALAAPGAPPVHVDEVVVGRVTGQLNFGVSIARTRRDGAAEAAGFNGLVNISVSPLPLGERLGRLRGRDGDVVSVMREDGAFLARAPPPGLRPPWRMPSEDPAYEQMRQGASRFEVRGPSPVDGAARLAAFRRVEGWPLYAAVAREQAVVVARWRDRVLLLLAVGLPATLALALLAVLVRRAQQAAETAQAGLEQRVRQRTAELASSEERLRMALEAADLGTFEVDLSSGAADRSPRMLEILGVPAAAARSPHGALRERIHPEDRPAIAAAVAELCRGMRERYAVEYRFQRPDGRWIHLESCGRVVERDAAGTPLRIAGTAQDVTARREAEERRALLAREVDHRAKNALTIVQAVLRLTPRDDAQAFAAAVEGRVAALARAHNLLAEHRWAGADLASVARGELATFLATDTAQPKATIDGPPMQVAAAAAQSLSLVFHELATNAVKHGALSTPDGRLEVRWSIEEAEGMLALTWRERGGPPPADGGRRGFGTRLVEAVVRDQLGGTLRRAWEPAGLAVAMHIPLGRVRAGGRLEVALEAAV